MRVRIVGAGVAGLTVAYEYASRGVQVELVEREEGPGRGCSWYAGGMIAPWCELESAEPLVCRLGTEALDFWTLRIPVAQTRGSLVVATPHDLAELRLFARRAQEFEKIGGNRIAELEPDLAGRFSARFFFLERPTSIGAWRWRRRRAALPRWRTCACGSASTRRRRTEKRIGPSIARATPRRRNCPDCAASRAR